MAGFSDGFNQGLNLMFSARRLGLYEEELDLRKKDREIESKPLSEISPAAGEMFAEGTTVAEAKAASDITASAERTKLIGLQADVLKAELDPDRLAAADASAQAILEQRKLQNERSELDNVMARKNLDKSIEFDNAVIMEELMNSVLVLNRDPNYQEAKGTPAAEAAESELSNLYTKLDKDAKIDLMSVFLPDTIAARNSLKPVIDTIRNQPEELGSVNFGDYNKELNQIFSIKKGVFLGKNFKKNDGTVSKVKNLEIDFSSIEAVSGSELRGGSILVKGNFELEDGSVVSSYIPDASREMLSESQQASDAVSVSLTDMMDSAASVDAMLSEVLKPENIGSIKIMQGIAERSKNRILRGDVDQLVKINSEAIKNQDRQIDATIEQWNMAGLSKQALRIGKGNPQAEDSAIKAIMGVFEFMEDVDILSDQEAQNLGFSGEGPFYRFKRDSQGALIKSPLDSVINQRVETQSAIAARLKKGTPFEEMKRENIPLPTAFKFANLSQEIQLTETLEEYLPRLEQAYPDINLRDIVNRYQEAWKNDPRNPNGQELTDQAILQLLARNRLLR